MPGMFDSLSRSHSHVSNSDLGPISSDIAIVKSSAASMPPAIHLDTGERRGISRL